MHFGFDPMFSDMIDGGKLTGAYPFIDDPNSDVGGVIIEGVLSLLPARAPSPPVGGRSQQVEPALAGDSHL